jgi:hypothetical protein
MGDQPLEPSELEAEFLALCRIAVGQVQAADQEPVDRGLDVTARRVVLVARRARRVSTSALPRERIATPFQLLSLCQIAS